jgi:hypothetical protein
MNRRWSARWFDRPSGRSPEAARGAGVRGARGPGRRRATVLLMVVSLLALLFVIVSGFLNLARQDRISQQQIQQGDEMSRIIDSCNEVVLQQLRRAWMSEGRILAGPPSGTTPASYVPPTWEDIPGYRGAHVIGVVSPVAVPDPDGTPAMPTWSLLPGDYARLAWTYYPSVGSMVRTGAPIQKRVLDLLLDDDPNHPSAVTGIDYYAILENARQPFLDADGDGVPDGWLPALALLTEKANEIAGRAVRVPRMSIDPSDPSGPRAVPFDPSALTDPNDPDAWQTLDEQWRRFIDQARFVVAARVVPHGGMISLDAPGVTLGSAGSTRVWNRSFVSGMLALLRRPGDNPGLSAMGLASQLALNDKLFNGMHAQAVSVEAALRRRGMLPAWGPAKAGKRDPDLARVPNILRELEGGGTFTEVGGPMFVFPRTLDFGYEAVGLVGGKTIPASWQRFNLGDGTLADAGEGLKSWTAAVRVNPGIYNATSGTGITATPPPTDDPKKSDRRHLVSVLSTSDELARRLAPEPVGAVMGVRHGQTKFYLGRVQEAFDASGNFDTAKGPMIVREIAAYYRDMISGHKFPDRSEPGSDSTYDVDANKQAMMLAVNTVSFAAPRRPHSGDPTALPGFVDVVRTNGPGLLSTTTFYGYAPQPFITQVTLYDNDQDGGDEDLGALVELYNPNDPVLDASGTVDAQALFLPQFAISFNDAGPLDPTKFVPLSQPAGTIGPDPAQPQRLPGRTFTTINFNAGSITGGAPIGGSPDPTIHPALESTTPGKYTVTVKLWRGNVGTVSGVAGAAWHVVDEMVVDVDPNLPSTDGDNWFQVAWRDCNTDPYFGPDPAAYPAVGPARWRMATGVESGDPGYRSLGGEGKPDSVSYPALPGTVSFSQTISTALPDAADPYDPGAAAVGRFGPTTPLYLMNAGAQDRLPGDPNAGVVLYGSVRPRSFPTPGFLLFVPRFSHWAKNPISGTPGGPGSEQAPMTRVLTKYLTGKGKTPSTTRYPADAGHMPIFDMTQELGSSSYFDNKEAGKVPWGQLVFDYFTTINPAGPDGVKGTADDVDPYRVPGRININAAPWEVLGQLPIVDPADLGARFGPGGPLELSGASPAFWSEGSGILRGVDRDPDPAMNRVRFLGHDPAPAGVPPNKRNHSLPVRAPGDPWMKLGPWLAQAAASYRDGLQYSSPVVGHDPAYAYSLSYLRNQQLPDVPLPGSPARAAYRDLGVYGGTAIRGQSSATTTPGVLFPDQAAKHSGFLSIGELANVIGFDSTPPAALAAATTPATGEPRQTLGNGMSPRHGDFVKAVSLLVLLDSQFLTTRSNTFTVYVSVMDRENPQASVRSQITVDRSNLLPRAVFGPATAPGGLPTYLGTVTAEADALPTVLSRRTSGYFNARYDD